MSYKKRSQPALKSNLHPNNKHRTRYNFEELITAFPDLAQFVAVNKYGDQSVDFFNPKAVFALNKALLFHFYKLQYWEIPDKALCPPIPGRADYLHYLHELLDKKEGSQIRCLDIGTGANCIYPLLGSSLFDWSFVAADIDPISVKCAQKNVSENPSVSQLVEIRFQENKTHFFNGIVRKDERFNACLCNPPFHASAAEAAAANQRKQRNLGRKNSKTLNFGGQSHELWYPGGEIAFLSKLILESKEFAHQIEWFSSLVSKEKNLEELFELLTHLKAKQIKEIPMGQGQKVSRILAWRF